MENHNMNPRILAAIVAAAALPVMAQAATPGIDPPTVQQDARSPQDAQSGAASARERAKLAKAQNKKTQQSRRIARQKQDRPKKAPAS
jgi:hypothetical protein